VPVVEEPVLVRHGESEGNVAASAAQAAGADVIVMEQRDPDVRPPLKPGLARTVRTPNDSEAELLLVRPLGDDLVADLRAIDSRYDAAIACHDLVDTPSGARAACWATNLHAAAGQRLASQVGRVGCLAREVLDELPSLLNALSRGVKPGRGRVSLLHRSEERGTGASTGRVRAGDDRPRRLWQ